MLSPNKFLLCRDCFASHYPEESNRAIVIVQFPPSDNQSKCALYFINTSGLPALSYATTGDSKRQTNKIK
ncbi:15174_t:CDS:2 [Funneliformis geosporum]|uniref:15174_t:CDS:1 n=1 Tax=Funneliformis geosporum TaxID=1117311 RepID=A0A9W4SPA9_9GLOM|nr:15174_t:CDS:2 [Funneliformis geosporum]